MEYIVLGINQAERERNEKIEDYYSSTRGKNYLYKWRLLSMQATTSNKLIH
jgi:hypothetical protein